MHRRLKSGTYPSLFLIIMVFSVSCVQMEKLRYFNDIDQLEEPIVNPKEQKIIMPFDKIYINVVSIDERTNQLFNSTANTSSTSSSSSSLSGYLVNETGSINYPFIGSVQVSGLTTEEAALKIGKAVNEYVSNASVSVKFIDNTVAILGEVGRQGSYPFSQDKLTIYEALALGGGIGQYGDRKNVILIRQEGNKIMHYKLDLSDSKIAEKDLYYIQANDVIVVDPIKSKSWYNFNNNTYSTILYSITTALAIFAIFFQ